MYTVEIDYHAFSWDQSTAKINRQLLLNLFQFLISVCGDQIKAAYTLEWALLDIVV